MPDKLEMQISIVNALVVLRKPVVIDKNTIENQNHLIAEAVELLEKGINH